MKNLLELHWVLADFFMLSVMYVLFFYDVTLHRRWTWWILRRQNQFVMHQNNKNIIIDLWWKAPPHMPAHISFWTQVLYAVSCLSPHTTCWSSIYDTSAFAVQLQEKRAEQDEQLRLKDVEIGHLKSAKIELDQEVRDARSFIDKVSNRGNHTMTLSIAEIFSHLNG